MHFKFMVISLLAAAPIAVSSTGDDFEEFALHVRDAPPFTLPFLYTDFAQSKAYNQAWSSGIKAGLKSGACKLKKSDIAKFCRKSNKPINARIKKVSKSRTKEFLDRREILDGGFGENPSWQTLVNGTYQSAYSHGLSLCTSGAKVLNEGQDRPYYCRDSSIDHYQCSKCKRLLQGKHTLSEKCSCGAGGMYRKWISKKQYTQAMGRTDEDHDEEALMARDAMPKFSLSNFGGSYSKGSKSSAGSDYYMGLQHGRTLCPNSRSAADDTLKYAEADTLRNQNTCSCPSTTITPSFAGGVTYNPNPYFP